MLFGILSTPFTILLVLMNLSVESISLSGAVLPASFSSIFFSRSSINSSKSVVIL